METTKAALVDILSRGRVTHQVLFILSTAPFAILDAFLPNFPLVDNIKMWWSFMDHSPVGYMSTPLNQYMISN